LEDIMFSRISIALVTLFVASPMFAAPRVIASKTKVRTTETSAPAKTSSSNNTQTATQVAETPAQPTFGIFSLSATQNGLAALAQFELLNSAGQVVLSGVSGADCAAPTGTFTVRSILSGGNGVINTTSITVNAEQRTEATAAFATGKLSLSISSSTGSTAGIAKVYVSGVEVGSLGNSNQVTLPAGTYDVKVLHSGAERWFYGVTLSQNQLRNISARF
jgi:hypothetical protein